MVHSQRCGCLQMAHARPQSFSIIHEALPSPACIRALTRFLSTRVRTSKTMDAAPHPAKGTSYKGSYGDLFQEAAEELSLSTISTGADVPDSYNNYEDTRAKRQLAHYFDYSASDATAAPSPATTITKKDVERFKARKQERKKIRHKWIFEK
jgi:hypothetical protein